MNLRPLQFLLALTLAAARCVAESGYVTVLVQDAKEHPVGLAESQFAIPVDILKSLRKKSDDRFSQAEFFSLFTSPVGTVVPASESRSLYSGWTGTFQGKVRNLSAGVNADVLIALRNVAFISNLMESGVEFVACDMPQANRFAVHILAAVAEQEAEAISKRTKAALAAAKARGTRLGGRRVSAERFAEIGAAGRQARTEKAEKWTADLLPTIRSIQAEGAVSLRQIAAGLNQRNIATPRRGEWTAVQVQRAFTAARWYARNHS
jgi:hypothetical protein